METILRLRANAALVARIDALAGPGETRSEVLRAGLVALAEQRGRP
jgi:Arc/MetJ-type ribon-helix-helix transcriptional regulator